MRLAVLLVMGAMVLLPAPTQAQAEENAWCAQDASHDHIIDTGDIGMFTNHFGEPYLELDYAPVPLGDGYVDTSEIGGVTALFGQTCLGIWSGSPQTPENMMRAASMTEGVPVDYPEIWGCAYNLAFPGYYISGNYAHLTSWAGGAGCMNGSGFYSISCEIQVRQMQPNGEWTIAAGLAPIIRAPGTICESSVSATAHSLRCGLVTAGWYFHDIWWSPQPGQELPWHGESHWMLSDFSQVFIPC